MITPKAYLQYFAKASTGEPPPPTRVISLSGNMDFAEVEVGSSSNATLTIGNSGSGPLTISSLGLPEGFSANWTSGEIASGGSQNVTVTFAPSAAQSYNGVITASSNATSGTNSIAVSASGVIPAAGYDSDSEAYFAAVEATGATLGSPTKEAFDEFVVGCKSASLWSKFVALYPFLGGTASSHAINAKAPGSYTISWNGSVTHSANGITGDGATGYGNTGLSPTTAPGLSTTSLALIAYARTADTTGASRAMLGSGTHTTVGLTILGRHNNGSKEVFTHGPSGSSEHSPTPSLSAQSLGTIIGTVNGSRAQNYYLNGSAQNTPLTASGNPADRSLYVLALNNNNAMTYASTRNLALAGIASGLDATQAATLSTLIQTLQTALGRNV